MSVVRRKNGEKWVQIPFQGKKYTFRLGKCSLDAARYYETRVKRLAVCRDRAIPIDGELEQWLQQLGDGPTNELLKSNLIVADVRHVINQISVRSLCDEYIVESYLRIKPSTLKNIEIALRNLTAFFGGNTLVSEISPDRVDDFRAYLDGEYAATTVTRRIKRCRELFAWAVRQRYLESNPFAHLKNWTHTNPERQRLITEDESRAVLGAIDCAEIRAIFVFSRWGGLRVPSEVLPLVWEWFQADRFRVFSPKNERYERKRYRDVPLFPEIEEALADLDQTTEHVISRRRQSRTAWDKAIRIAIKKTDVVPWPKMFNNLRSSRQSDLIGIYGYPIHVVCQWLGNSTAVAIEHYLQVPDDVYAQAKRNTKLRIDPNRSAADEST